MASEEWWWGQENRRMMGVRWADGDQAWHASAPAKRAARIGCGCSMYSIRQQRAALSTHTAAAKSAAYGVGDVT